VHGAWKYFIDFDNKVLNINVGVDVWKYNPVSEDELIAYIDSIMRSNGGLSRK
jgi:calcineurin-like phosphoesterase family protein